MIIMIAMAIAIVTHGWSIHRKEKMEKSLADFLNKFDGGGCSLEENNVSFEEGMAGPLLMLANAFTKSGNYGKAISICLYLIRHTHDDKLLIFLGKVYQSAGFLQRAEKIFLEIIKRHPRETDILYRLEFLYETLQDYPKAREAISALKAQNMDTSLHESHLDLLEIVSDKGSTSVEKAAGLSSMLEENPHFYRAIMQELFRLDTDLAWKHMDNRKIDLLLDILWLLMPTQLRLDIIAEDEVLSAIYYARGDLKREVKPKECGIFTIDMLSAAKFGGYEEGDLQFSYICSSCKESFPVSFLRCPNCMKINTIKVEDSLVQEGPQRGYTIF